MTPEALRALQQPLKARYRDDPATAALTLTATGTIAPERLECQVGEPPATVVAGLHPLAGGDGSTACSATLLLEAIAACAGVTLSAVATAMGLTLRAARVAVHGDLDFRGTLGVDRETSVGLQAIRLAFDVDTDADDAQLATLLRLTERYCVVLQSLRQPPAIEARISRT
jgi:uncharacterized OsmC-like protein